MLTMSSSVIFFTCDGVKTSGCPSLTVRVRSSLKDSATSSLSFVARIYKHKEEMSNDEHKADLTEQQMI